MSMTTRCAAFALMCVLLLGAGMRVQAQDAAAPAFSPEQLEQIVAPVALYADPLLAQVLMASTYPLEVVEADRWVAQNKALSDAALDEALKNEDWDPSVKSLTHVPDVLSLMSQNLDWTQDLGDAFLAQQSDVMDSVQRMRGKAYEAGNLQSTEQQVVTKQPDNIIVVQSPSPEVIYVPSYSPTVVYGPAWSYPSYYYPAMYYPPAPGYGLVTFGVGMAVGAAIWGNTNWGWGRGDVDIDIDRHNEFNRNTNINADRTNLSASREGNRANWQHDASHRKGVNYPNENVARQHGAREGESRVSRDQARGRSEPGGTGRTQARDLSAAGSGARAPSAGQLDRSQVDRSGAGARAPDRAQVDRAQTAGRADTSARQVDRGAGTRTASRDSAYSGSRNAGFDRSASSRGATSRGTASYSGGGRAGGGRAGGGRR